MRSQVRKIVYVLRNFDSLADRFIQCLMPTMFDEALTLRRERFFLHFRPLIGLIGKNRTPAHSITDVICYNTQIRMPQTTKRQTLALIYSFIYQNGGLYGQCE